eukprot:ctg_148.g114
MLARRAHIRSHRTAPSRVSCGTDDRRLDRAPECTRDAANRPNPNGRPTETNPCATGGCRWGGRARAVSGIGRHQLPHRANRAAGAVHIAATAGAATERHHRNTRAGDAGGAGRAGLVFEQDTRRRRAGEQAEAAATGSILQPHHRHAAAGTIRVALAAGAVSDTEPTDGDCRSARRAPTAADHAGAGLQSIAGHRRECAPSGGHAGELVAGAQQNRATGEPAHAAPTEAPVGAEQSHHLHRHRIARLRGHLAGALPQPQRHRPLERSGYVDGTAGAGREHQCRGTHRRVVGVADASGRVVDQRQPDPRLDRTGGAAEQSLVAHAVFRGQSGRPEIARRRGRAGVSGAGAGGAALAHSDRCRTGGAGVGAGHGLMRVLVFASL